MPKVILGASVLVAMVVQAARAESFVAPPMSLAPVTLDSTSAAAEGDAAPAEDPGYGMAGNLFGARDKLHERGIDVGGSLIFDVSKVLRGGLDTEAWPVSYLLDLHVTVDMEKFGIQGGTLFACFQSHDQSENGDAAVGDLQVFDNISAVRYVQVSQFWYRQTAGDFRLKVGKIDANADACLPSADANDCFSLMEHGLDFIQSSAAFSPTIFTLPTFPEGCPGIEVFYSADVGKKGTSDLGLRDVSLYAGTGAFYCNAHQTFLNIAGHPEKGYASNGGMFVIGEVGARWDLHAGDSLGGPGHAGVGAWYHCGNFPRIDGSENNRGAGGGYAFIDQSIYHYEAEGEATRDVGFFLQVGIADKTTSPMDQNLILGFSASGFVPGRPDDSMGVMASWVHLPAQAGLAHSFELATEAFYKIQLTSWASLKPSLAYIVNPSGTLPDAAVVTLRAEIDF